MGTLLAFDFGPAKIGVAVGETLTGTASPVATLRAVRQKPDWRGIGHLIDTWQPDALVVGLPHNMDDSESEGIAAQARRFSRQLSGRYRLPVHLVDERLTSVAARQQLGRPKKIEDLDAFAAKLILETWLSEQK